MHKIIEAVRKVFSFSQNEAIGTLVLIGLIALFVFGGQVADRLFGATNAEIRIVETERLDSLTQERQYPYAKNNYRNSDNYDYRPMAEKSNAEVFAFDPNTASADDLRRLGLSPKVVHTIQNYRNKKGVFRYKEDLARIYGLSTEDYERLESYIQLPGKERLSVETPQAEQAGRYVPPVVEASPAAPPAYAAKPKAVQPFDLNTADTTQLKQIRGIGSGYARQIVKYRESLGGFYSLEQVRDTYNLPPETADELLKFARLESPPRKVNVNTVALKDFRHSSLTYNQRKAIVNYREQHGNFGGADDLRKIKILDEKSLQNFLPYAEF